MLFQSCNKEVMMSYIEMNKMNKLIQCMHMFLVFRAIVILYNFEYA